MCTSFNTWVLFLAHSLARCVLVQCVLCALAFFGCFHSFRVLLLLYINITKYKSMTAFEWNLVFIIHLFLASLLFFSFALLNWTAMTLVYSIVIGVLFLLSQELKSLEMRIIPLLLQLHLPSSLFLVAFIPRPGNRNNEKNRGKNYYFDLVVKYLYSYVWHRQCFHLLLFFFSGSLK